MGPLPDFERAIIPAEKLRYVLNPEHSTGKNKARVFRSALGLSVDDGDALEAVLRAGIREHFAVLNGFTPEGKPRWLVEWVVQGRLTPMRMVSAWEWVSEGQGPRLLSCYLKKVK